LDSRRDRDRRRGIPSRCHRKVHGGGTPRFLQIGYGHRPDRLASNCLDPQRIDAAIDDAVVGAGDEVVVHASLGESSLRFLALQAMVRGVAIAKMVDRNEGE
jgi:hypothetical protein